MHRYRIVATGVDSPKGYTLHLVRYISDAQAIGLMKTSISAARHRIKNTAVLVAYREQFNVAGFTTSRVELDRMVLDND